MKLFILLTAATLFQISSAAAADCEIGTPASGAVVHVKGQGHSLYQRPDSKAQKILNQKATAILKEPQYHAIDSATQVRLLCTHNSWVKIRIASPDWLTDVVGWVASKAVAMPTSGPRTISAEDIYWDKHTKPHKAMIVDAVNRIHREDPRCKDIDPSSVSRSSSKGTAAKPVFFVMCGTGVNVVNVFFSADDVASSKPFSAPQHIKRERAVQLCENYAKQSATHPSTVSFSKFMSLAVTDHPNGRTTVTSSFTAKNTFNLELTHNIRCLLNADGLIEATISDAP